MLAPSDADNYSEPSRQGALKNQLNPRSSTSHPVSIQRYSFSELEIPLTASRFSCQSDVEVGETCSFFKDDLTASSSQSADETVGAHFFSLDESTSSPLCPSSDHSDSKTRLDDSKYDERFSSDDLLLFCNTSDNHDASYFYNDDSVALIGWKDSSIVSTQVFVEQSKCALELTEELNDGADSFSWMDWVHDSDSMDSGVIMPTRPT